MVIQAKVIQPRPAPLKVRAIHTPALPPEHAVVSAVRSHLAEKIAEALADFPEHLEADFSGLLNHVIFFF